MTRPPKKPLSLLTDDAQEERRVTLNVVDALLPCRFFEIDHKVAVLGKASLTTELILRLVKASDGISEEKAAVFFGFDLREINFVLSEAESLGYVERRDGALWITASGAALFREGAAEPEIFEVEKSTLKVGFDLIAFAPQRGVALDRFERLLPELPLGETPFAARGASSAPNAFRKHFLEIGRARDLGKKSLYSVDEARPGDRFSSVVRIVVSVSNLRPSQPEIDLGEWRPEDEQQDRKEIRMSAAAFVHDLQTTEAASNRAAYDTLVAIAPDYLKGFVGRAGLNVPTYFREMVGRAGEVRIDRPTIPIVGSLFVPENVRRFVEVATYGKRNREAARAAIWCAPAIPHWGATADLPDMLIELGHHLGGAQDFESLCLTPHRFDERRLKHAFTRVGPISDQWPAPALECLLIPNIACAVLVNAPIGAARGYPVGLGIMSFDADVVERAKDLVIRGAPDPGDLASLFAP